MNKEQKKRNEENEGKDERKEGKMKDIREE